MKRIVVSLQFNLKKKNNETWKKRREKNLYFVRLIVICYDYKME